MTQRMSNMPGGYYPLKDEGVWYILKDAQEGQNRPFMKRLLDSHGNNKCFSQNEFAQLVDYAQKHAELNLAYNEIVPEVKP